MKTSLASCCSILNFKGTEKKKSLPVKAVPKTMNPPNEAGFIRRQSDQIKFRPRMQSVPELRGLQRRPSVCYYRYVLPPIVIPINQRELPNNGNQARVHTPVHPPPPAPYYCHLPQVYVPGPPQYYCIQRYYPQRIYYPYPPFPQR